MAIDNYARSLASAALNNGSGKGGTTDYGQLTNKPCINGKELNGNLSSEDLGIPTNQSIYMGEMHEYTSTNPLDLTNFLGDGYVLYDTQKGNLSVLYIQLNIKGKNVVKAIDMRAISQSGFKFFPVYIHKIHTQEEYEASAVYAFTLTSMYLDNTEGRESIGFRAQHYLVSNGDIVTNSYSHALLEPVTKGGKQTITGVKNFTKLPESNIEPTTNNQLVNKKYVDDTIADAITTTLEGEY